MAIIPLTVHAEWYNEYTFVVGDGVSTPITVRCNGKSYKVYSSLTINFTGSTGSVSATDSYGNSLKYESSNKTVNKGYDTYHYNTYVFYNRSSYGSSRSNGSTGYGGGNSNNYDYSGARQAGQAIGHAIFTGGGGVGDAYPSLQLLTGISRSYGVNAKLKWASVSGFLLYGSVGKDWLFDSEYSNRVLWNAGMGSYFGFGGGGNHNMDISLGLSVGQQAQWEKLCMMIDVDYTCWIGRWRRVGVFAGGSLGWGDFVNVFDTDDVNSSSGFAWNLEAGIVFRLANF